MSARDRHHSPEEWVDYARGLSVGAEYLAMTAHLEHCMVYRLSKIRDCDIFLSVNFIDDLTHGDTIDTRTD